MSSIAPSLVRDNNSQLYEPVEVRLRIDGVNLSFLDSVLIRKVEVASLMERIDGSSTVEFLNWECTGRCLSQHEAYIQLATSESPAYSFVVNGKSTGVSDPFAATLAISLTPTDLKQPERLTELAIRAAASCFPKSASP